jgi:hypothetical protein
MRNKSNSLFTVRAGSFSPPTRRPSRIPLVHSRAAAIVYRSFATVLESRCDAITLLYVLFMNRIKAS